MANSKSGRIIAWITAILVILTGIIFIVCCSHLYFTGDDQPYTRDRAALYLIAPMISGVITLGLAASGGILAAITGAKGNESAPRTKIEMLESFAKRYDINDFGDETKSKILKSRTLRALFKYLSLAFSAVIFLLVLIYICFFAKFTIENLNSDVIMALGVALPLCAIAVGVHVIRLYANELSASRELETMKAYIKENGSIKAIAKTEEKKKFDYAIIVRCLILAVAIIFVTVGVFNGGMSDVLQKAVKICTECIGLG